MLSALEYAQMREAFERMPAQEFVRQAQAAAQVHGDDARLLFVLGASLHRLGELEPALAAFGRVLELQPGHVQAINAKAALLAGLGRGEQAREALEEARRRYPRDVSVLVNLGYLLEQQEQGREQALRCYDEALALEGSNQAALMNRGYLLTVLGRLPEAVQNNRVLVAHHPQLATAHFNLAESLLAAGATAEAIAASSRALELDDRLTGARVTRIFACARSADLELAQRDLDRLAVLDPGAVPEMMRRLFGPAGESLEHVDARSIHLHLMYNAIQECDWSRWDAFVATFRELVLHPRSRGEIRDATLPFISLSFPVGMDARLKLAQGVARGLREKVGERVRPHRPARRGSASASPMSRPISGATPAAT